MPLSFPSSPSVNQTSTQNGRTYKWTGSVWEFVSSGGGGSGLSWSSVPASATASGTAGQIAYDGSYFYLAPQNNTWVRTALSTWAVFTPASVTGLQLWLDASDASSLYDATTGGSLVAADGGVARWEDKSGNARHMTQATSGSRPLRKASQQNGKDTLLFDGTNDFLDGSDFLDASTGGLTAFVVYKRNATGANHELVYKMDTNGKGWLLRHADSNKLSIYNDTSSGTCNRLTSSTVTATSYIVATFSATSGSFQQAGAYRNGAALQMDAAITSGDGAQSPDNTSAIVRIGIQEYLGTYYNPASANIAEVILYNSALGNTDRAAVENYLISKWSLT
jgi:hypothetical protein